MIRTALTAAFAATVMTGCMSNPDYSSRSIPGYVVHHPDESVPAATLHTEATAQLSVPNAEHRHLDVAIIKINDRALQTSHPVVVPSGVHNITFRCELQSKKYDATENRIFTGQSQWFLKPNTTYTIVPSFEIDDYANPICSAKLASRL
jgi:hypothetical protein